MAISSQISSVSYTGNASTSTPYPVTFRYDDPAWVTVQEIDEDGAVTTLSLGTDYTLTGNGSTTTGNVVTGGGAIPATSTLRISRDTAITQNVSLAVNGVIPSAVIEAEFDKLTMAQLDQKRRQAAGDARSLRVPDGETAAELPAAPLRAGEVLFFNATTGAVETKTPDEILALSSGAPDGIGIPAGGTTGQALVKTSATNYAVEWGDLTVSPAGVASAAALMTDTQSRTTREGLRLDDAEIADSLNWQPNCIAKLAAQTAPLRVLVVGDSLSTGLRTPPNMMPVGVIGLSRTSAVTSVTEVNSDFADIWIAPYHSIAAGGSAVYHQGTPGAATPVPVRANTRLVLYIAEPGAGSFDIATSTDNGATWGSPTTINASNGTRIGVAASASLSTSNSPRYLARINNVTGGPVKIIGVGLFNSTGIGCIELRSLANLAGLDLFNFGRVPDAIFNPIWTAMAPDLVVSHFADAPEDWQETKLALSNVVTNGTTTITFAAYPATEYAGGQTFRPFPRVGDYVTGANIPAGTRIASHTKDSTTATLTVAATGSGTNPANIRGAWSAFYDRCKAIRPGTDFIQLSTNPFFSPPISGHPRWISGTAYTAGQRVTMYSADGTLTPGESDGVYVCTANHTAGTTNKPESGASWATVWTEDVLDAASITAGTLRARQQALAQRDWALRRGESFINGLGMFRDYGAACAVGLMATPDQVHPTPNGHIYKNLVVWSKIPLARLFLGSLGSYNVATSGQGEHILGITGAAHPSTLTAFLDLFRPLRLSGSSAQLNIGDRSVPENVGLDVVLSNTGGDLLIGDKAIAGRSSFTGLHAPFNGATLGGRGSFWWNLGGAGLRLEYTPVTANYTITAADYTIDVTANSPTITLPAAAALNSSVGNFSNAAAGAEGKIYVIRNTGAGTVTMATTSSQLIDGSAPGTIAAGGSLKVQSTGTGWITIP